MFKREDIPDGGGIYIYTCIITHSKYVGKCSNFMERVWKEILNLRIFSRNNKYKDNISKDLQDAFKEHGEENFELSYYTTDDDEVADVLEYYYIKKYDCVLDGYNGNNRDIKNIFETHKARIYSDSVHIVLNEEETMLSHKLKEIFNYKQYLLKEYVTFNQLLNEFRALQNRDLESVQLLKIIKTSHMCIYIKSIVNNFYYEISYYELEGLLFHNNNYLNYVIRDEFIECDNMLENILLESLEFMDKRNYINRVKGHNAECNDYIHLLEGHIYHDQKRHLRNIKNSLGHNCYSESAEILRKGKELKESIQENLISLKFINSKVINTPRYIEDEEFKIVNNPKIITKIESVRIRD